MTSQSDLHSEKQEFPRNSTLDGIRIFLMALLENADLSIRRNLLSLSNMILQRDLHSEKQDSPRNSTLHGI
jgi:hypothetical protein